MIHYFLLISFFTTLLHLHSKPLINLDDNFQEFILEEKQIHIPFYPTAFNPSLVRLKNKRLLLCFRARDPLTHQANLIGFVFLTDDFELDSEPTLLSIYGALPLNISKEQDPRLIQVGDDVYIVYNNIFSNENLEARRMIAAKLHFFNGHFYIVNPKYLLYFSGDKKNWIEKNWAPFDYNEKLHFSYSINPHKVFKLAKEESTCETLSITQTPLNWEYGEIRGGTPALLDGNEYLGFFHSYINMKSEQSNGEKISHYFMGAYRFENKPPFKLTHISKTPIIGKTFYTPTDFKTWKPLRVVFPGGVVFDDEFIHVVYGKQDHETWVVKMSKKGLLNSLNQVAQ